MRPLPRDEQRISEEAAVWLETLKRGSAAEREAFAAWVKESPRHVRAFLLMTAVDIELDGVDPQRNHAIEIPSGNVVAIDGTARRTSDRKPRVRYSPLLWAAGIAAAAVAVALFISFGDTRYSTHTGEQRTFSLPDGSVVHLNTQSRIALNFSSSEREIVLKDGEALFKVARDTARPFRVRTEDAVIQAIGTQFNVRHDRHGTEVAVIEGQVRVADQTRPFGAGEGAAIRRNVPGVERVAADVAQAVAWRERRLVFRSDTLTDIAAEFNRYNSALHIRIGDTVVGSRRFSGVFDAEDPESFATVLQGNRSLEVQRVEGEIVIRERERQYAE